MTTQFKRNVLSDKATHQAVECLQQRLVDLIDLSLQLKQAHWCVVGSNFRDVHLQIDEIIVDTRNASDEIAERIATLGVAPDGRAKAIVAGTQLPELSSSFESTADTVTAVANRLQKVIDGLRESIEKLGDIDPISEDMLIAVAGPLEKHLWMVQSQEV